MSIIDDAITEAIEQGRPFTIDDIHAMVTARHDGESEPTSRKTLALRLGRLHRDDRIDAVGRVHVDGRRLRVWAPREAEMIAWQTLRNVPVLEVAEYCWRNNAAVVFRADELRALAAQDEEFAAITEEVA
jgi:hypothetical protein